MKKFILISAILFLSASMVYAAVTPSPTDSRTLFGSRPIFSPGGSIKVIVDDFGWIDYTLIPQQRDDIKNSIADWEAQGIAYGTYYALQHLETSAGDDPDLAVALPTNLDGTTGSNFSIARQGALDYWIASGKLAIDLGASYFFMDEAAGAISTLSFDSETVAAFNTYLTENHTAGEISAFDIANVSNFDYANHLRANGWLNSTQVQNHPPTDALYKAWLAYMLSVERNFFNQWTTQLRAYGLANYNRTIYLSANRYTGARSWDILDLFDFGMAETFLDSLGWPYGHLAFVNKTIVNFDKKFWSWNFPAHTEATDSNESARLFAAETFAAGGLVQHGSGSSWSGFHHKKERMDFLRSFLQFPTLQPTAFNLAEAGQFAVLYSEIGEVDDPGSTTSSFRGATYLLTDMQWTYDVVFAAHPNRRDGNELLTLAQLQLYDAVILPNTRHMTDAQIVLLEQYVNAGGILIGFGTIADNDHTGQIRSGDRSFDDYFGTDKEQAVGSGFIISFKNNLGGNYESNKTSATSKSTIRESFSNLVDSRVSPEVGLTYSGSGTASGESPDVFVNRYKADDGSWVFHIVNRQIVIPTANPSQASMTPLENASLDVLLPTEFDSDTVSVSFVDADSPSVNSLSFETSGDRISFTLPTFSIWSVVRVGSAMPATGAYDEPPQSNPYFLGDLDNDGAGSTGRPNKENASGEIRFPVWYWKGGNHGPVPWDVPFFATDDVGLKKVHLYYRYSSDESTWGDWSLYESTDLSGTLVYGSFSFTAPDGEGFYELYTQVVDTSDQEETISPWAENGYGVDQTAPGHPTNVTASNDIKNGYWTTDMDDLTFTWESAVDNLSGVDNYQASIRYGAGTAIFLKNLDTATTWTPSGRSADWDADWSTDLMNLGTAYRLGIRTSDTAGNINSGQNTFDLLYGESPVADVVNPAVVEGDSKLTVSWEVPADPNYIGMVVRVRPASDQGEVSQSGGTSWVESGFAPVAEASQLVYGGLENKVAYTVRVVAYAADNKEGNYVTLTGSYTPDIDSDGDGVLDYKDVFPLDASEQLDTDSDGTGNNADTDDDGDEVLDTVDAFPLDATESVDTDGDGTGNNADTDDDGDGALDINDPYPLNAPPTLTFTYGDNTNKPIAGITLTLTESDSTVTTLTSDTNGQVKLPLDPTATNTYTLAASLTDTGTDPISVQDALYILQHIVELRTLNAIQIKAADINSDDNLTIQDALKVLQHNVELITIENPLIFLDANTNNPLAETTFSPTDTPSIAVYRLGDVNLSFTPNTELGENYRSNPDLSGQFLDAVLINRNPDCRAYNTDANAGNYGSAQISDLSNGTSDGVSRVQIDIVIANNWNADAYNYDNVTVTSDPSEATHCRIISNMIPNHTFGVAITGPGGGGWVRAIDHSDTETTYIPVSPGRSNVASDTPRNPPIYDFDGILLNGVGIAMDSGFCYNPGVTTGPLSLRSNEAGNTSGCGPQNTWFELPAYSIWHHGAENMAAVFDDYFAHGYVGTYHYHAMTHPLQEDNDQTQPPSNGDGSPVIGFAPDGFPIYGHWFIDQNNLLVKAESGYETYTTDSRTPIPSALHGTPPTPWDIVNRPGDFDSDFGLEIGRYEQDWYFAGTGNLDECNGAVDVNGDYGYYVTDKYPFTPLCTFGDRDPSFGKRSPTLPE